MRTATRLALISTSWVAHRLHVPVFTVHPRISCTRPDILVSATPNSVACPRLYGKLLAHGVRPEPNPPSQLIAVGISSLPEYINILQGKEACHLGYYILVRLYPPVLTIDRYEVCFSLILMPYAFCQQYIAVCSLKVA